jgi:uncharacterized beta-barrel protein YwiB (DUF1934 family)
MPPLAAPVTRGHFFRGSSAALTYVTPHGPIPLSCTTTSSLFHAKWFAFGDGYQLVKLYDVFVLGETVHFYPQAK